MKPFQCLLVLGIFYLHCQVTESSLSRSAIVKAVAEAKAMVDSAYQYSRRESLARVKRNAASPADVLRVMKQPSGPVRTAVRAADYMANAVQIIKMSYGKRSRRSINATDLISEEDLNVIADLTGCSARHRVPACKTTLGLEKFRTASSVCNNRKNERYGASSIPFVRLLPAEYEDGRSVPKGWTKNKKFNGKVLPLVREVSNQILRTANEDVKSDPIYTHLVTIFGQWTDHDLTFTPHSPVIRSFNNGIDCDKTCERTEPCFPIKVPKNDPRFAYRSEECIPFFRSAPACGSGNTGHNFGAATVRQQINGLTAFIDVGQVYGSDDAKARSLRNLNTDEGLLRVNTKYDDNGRELLPFSTMKTNMCANRARITNDSSAQEVPCFYAGDERANENIGLSSLHTLFLREHNRLARALAKLNPHWSGERLYQEARKIMGAYLQVITYRDYLLHIVGPKVLKEKLSTYNGYNESIDPSISNVFATAAYRFAHTMVQPYMFRLNETFDDDPNFPSPLLHRALNTPWRLPFEGGVDPILRGLVGRKAKLNTQDAIMSDELRDRLFKFSKALALDLAALNLQRGRDHGLPGYTKWRKYCGLFVPKNERELATVLKNATLAKKLIQLYGTPENIDVWLGGVAEPFISGARTGPLFACLIADQFQKIREGDRLWWENKGVFTEAQRESIRKTSLARIICDNTGITEVPAKPFLYRPRGKGYTKCKDIPAFDLSPWKENSSGLEGTMGSRGPPGPPGPPGPKGERGPPGHAVNVAFSVRLGNDISDSYGPIIFRDVSYNGRGCYNINTGIFKCEQAGVYEFSFHCTSPNSGSSIDLMHNGNLILHSYTTKGQGSVQASGDIYVHLKTGDEVWLKANEKTKTISKHSIFSGHLLYIE